MWLMLKIYNDPSSYICTVGGIKRLPGLAYVHLNRVVSSLRIVMPL
jgi:hypothetical protein